MQLEVLPLVCMLFFFILFIMGNALALPGVKSYNVSVYRVLLFVLQSPIQMEMGDRRNFGGIEIYLI